jgi:DNA-binding protein Fis
MEQSLYNFGAALVGDVSVDAAQNTLKRAMLAEAVTRSSGNLTRAANLLGVKRQAVQQMLNRYEMRHWASSMRSKIESAGDALRP